MGDKNVRSQVPVTVWMAVGEKKATNPSLVEVGGALRLHLLCGV